MEETKKCTLCGKVKPLDEFYSSKHSKDGKHSWCKECFLTNQKARRNVNVNIPSNPVSGDAEIEIAVNGFNLSAIEYDIIKKALRYYDDCSLKFIAKKLGISERTLLRKLKEYGIDHEAERRNQSNDIKTKKTLEDYEPRELLKALWDKGYDGHFFTYVKQEMSLSKLFGAK